MNDVRINGIRYVPETNKPNNHHVKRLSSVLAKECPYLSRDVRNTIVRKFEVVGEKETKLGDEKEKPKFKVNARSPYSPRTKLFNLNNIKGIDEEGHILYKRGGNVSQWTIYDATEIRQWMNYGKPIDNSRINKFSEKFGVSVDHINRLIFNLENEEFNRWLDIMVSKNVISKPEEEKPKREDVGWFE